jgi:ubiquinone/menaquinone biosynthesis C-methylase UbiE
MTKYQNEIISYYNQFDEHNRLSSGYGQLEKIRTERILDRYLPKPPAVVLDVGGGTGVYALALAKREYEVHLIDLSPAHIEKAKSMSKTQPEQPLASISIGNAKNIEMENNSADAALFFGPLYHLTKKSDRIKALQEAHRVLRPNGLLFASAISKFSSLIDGILGEYIKDRDFVRIVERDLKDGQHRNPKYKPHYFTTSFFHHPEELRSELETGGFNVRSVLAIEGPMWITNDFDEYWKDKKLRKHILSFAEKIENEPTILGASEHIMAIGQK